MVPSVIRVSIIFTRKFRHALIASILQSILLWHVNFRNRTSFEINMRKNRRKCYIFLYTFAKISLSNYTVNLTINLSLCLDSVIIYPFWPFSSYQIWLLANQTIDTTTISNRV